MAGQDAQPSACSLSPFLFSFSLFSVLRLVCARRIRRQTAFLTSATLLLFSFFFLRFEPEKNSIEVNSASRFPPLPSPSSLLGQAEEKGEKGKKFSTSRDPLPSSPPSSLSLLSFPSLPPLLPQHDNEGIIVPACGPAFLLFLPSFPPSSPLFADAHATNVKTTTRWTRAFFSPLLPSFFPNCMRRREVLAWRALPSPPPPSLPSQGANIKEGGRSHATFPFFSFPSLFFLFSVPSPADTASSRAPLPLS